MLADGLAEIYVADGKMLDYETQSVYALSISVTGLGLTTDSTLTVNIIDVNEPHNFTNLPNSVDVSAASTSAGDEVRARSHKDIVLQEETLLLRNAGEGRSEKLR